METKNKKEESEPQLQDSSSIVDTKKGRSTGHNNQSSDRRQRQWSIITEDELKSKKFVIIGVGGIGSWLTLLLAKMGIENIVTFDHDIVEDHNVASQLFDEQQVGMLKVAAIRKFIERNLGTKIEISPSEFSMEKVEIDSSTIVMICVDSLEVRKEIADMLKFEVVGGIIDGRMGGEQVEVYTYTSAMDYYGDMQNVGEAEPDVCTARAIVYNTNFCSSIMCAQAKKLIKSQPFKKNIVVDLGSMSFMTSK